MDHFFPNYLSAFVARFDGPFHLRLIMQPLMATTLAIRHGIKDAREERAPYCWAILHDPAHRRYLLADGWKDISKVFILACLLDVVYQLIALHRLRPLGALLTAIILAVVPYLEPISKLSEQNA